MIVATTQLIIDWLTSIGWDTQAELGYPLLPGALIVDEPDQAVFITGTGGPGYITEEGSADAWTFQARVRGPSDDPFTPETMAKQLDALIKIALFPAMTDAVPIQHVHRLGGPPAPLPVDPDDLRHEFTCNYVAIIGA